MKNKIILILALVTANLLSPSALAQEIEWLKLNEAQQLNNKTKTEKWTIIDMYTPWCGPCRMMEKSTFTDSSVIVLMDHFHAVKFNAEGPDDVTYNGKVYSNPNYDVTKGNGRNYAHQLTSHFRITGYPTLILLDREGEIVERIVGYQTPERMIDILERIIKTQSEQ